MDQPLVTACLIVRNEEANIQRCLASLEGLADEVVAVDTGSTDATVRLLEEAGATVRHEAWADDFALHRNQAIEMASGQWILSIDADEEVMETNVVETRARLSADGLPDILLTRLRLEYPNGKTMALTSPRLFRRLDSMRYTYAVHEQLDVVQAPAALSNVTIHHHGYADAVALRGKEARNLRIAEKMPHCAHTLHCIVRASFSLQQWGKTVEAALELITADDALPSLKTEACSIGAAAAFNARDTKNMTRFLEVGAQIAPDSPDIRLMELLAAVARYLHSLKDGDSTDEDRVYLRPWLFQHRRDVALEIFNALHQATH